MSVDCGEYLAAVLRLGDDLETVVTGEEHP